MYLARALLSSSRASASTLRPAAASFSSSSISSVRSSRKTRTAPVGDVPDKLENTHYCITLLRSPLHLPIASQRTCQALGLGKRMNRTIVPISSVNAGYILSIKELVGVELVNLEEVQTREYEREMLRVERGDVEGRRGAGLTAHNPANWELSLGSSSGVVRVGKDRCRGSERGFKVVGRL